MRRVLAVGIVVTAGLVAAVVPGAAATAGLEFSDPVGDVRFSPDSPDDAETLLDVVRVEASTRRAQGSDVLRVRVVFHQPIRDDLGELYQRTALRGRAGQGRGAVGVEALVVMEGGRRVILLGDVRNDAPGCHRPPIVLRQRSVEVRVPRACLPRRGLTWTAVARFGDNDPSTSWEGTDAVALGRLRGLLG